jgi:type I restriction-modification system specificity subunit (fragment)
LDDKIENNEKITILLLKKIQFYYIEKFLKKSKTLVPFQYFIDSTIGGDWGKDEPSKSNNTKVICIRGADISDISQGKEGSPPTRFILEKNCKLKKLCAWDIIVEISGGSPTQSTGRSTLITNYLLDLYNTPIICTNFCRAIKCKKVEYAPYVYAAFNYLYNTNVFFNYENGTTGIKNLDLDAILNEQEVYLPSESELVDFYNYTKDIQEQVMRLRTENQKLNELKQLYLKKFFG